MNIIRRIILWAAGIKDLTTLIPIEVKVDAYSRQHLNADGSMKAQYRDLQTAIRGQKRMEDKTGLKFNAYKCCLCDGYHIGRTNR